MKKLRTPLFIALLAGAALWLAFRPGDHYFEISKNIDIFGKVLREVDNNYVDDIEPNEFIRIGLDAMLSSLDPYTTYISASEIEDYQYQSTGQYGGIGAIITKRNQKIMVRECYPDRPAYKAGLRAGDEILQIDGQAVDGTTLGTLDVRNLLRGTPGTSVKLLVNRIQEAKPLAVDITRETIKVNNVPYYGMVNDEIGYISLSGFTKDAGSEVVQALTALKKNERLKGVILDLRGNPGGLLFEAINVSNVFIPKGEKVVETRGKMEGSFRRFLAENTAIDTHIPLAVLIDGHSASASEIVSGVMQDLDRAVIIGRRSYGKGLVQTTRPLSYRSQIKMTTSRYYTPSGRCIQAIDYSHREKGGSVVKIADSLRSTYYTRNKRPVTDAGGIFPDIIVPRTRYHQITQELVSKDLIFDFATQYHRNHPEIGPARDFRVTDELYQAFVAYVAAARFEYESRFAQELKNLEKMLAEEKYYAAVKPAYDQLAQTITLQKQQDIQDYKEEIKLILREEIARRYYNQAGFIEAGFSEDPYIQKAVEALSISTTYAQLLDGSLRLNQNLEEAVDDEKQSTMRESDE
ncbi:MAG: S41 family peptidase [Bacteroidetes bacterium]|jgi:carboxyl-terminal processing protease|nr:S41 family peptidase [Bacteroidota bacterium]